VLVLLIRGIYDISLSYFLGSFTKTDTDVKAVLKLEILGDAMLVLLVRGFMIQAYDILRYDTISLSSLIQIGKGV
jgi:hypothetical protein